MRPRVSCRQEASNPRNLGPTSFFCSFLGYLSNANLLQGVLPLSFGGSQSTGLVLHSSKLGIHTMSHLP